MYIYCRTVKKFNTQSQQWSSLADLSVGRYYFGCVFVDVQRKPGQSVSGILVAGAPGVKRSTEFMSLTTMRWEHFFLIYLIVLTF